MAEMNTNSTNQEGSIQSPALPRRRGSEGQLRRDEIDAILERNHIGRIAFTANDRVDIEPIHYVHKYGWLYGRTSKGRKLDAMMSHPNVAFQVDEVEGVFDWRSVVVRGTVECLNPVPMPEMGADDMARHEDPAFAQGVALLKSLIPDSLQAGDPTPHRYIAFRVHIDEVSGYSAQSESVVRRPVDTAQSHLASANVQPKQKPVFWKLDRQAAEQILSRNHVGRLACSFHDRVDIELVQYVYSDGWIYGETNHAETLPIAAHNPWVAFEVDEAKGLFDWCSVVAKGTFELVDAAAKGQDAAVARGVELLHTLVRTPLADTLPAPLRQHVFRLHVDEMTAREASSSE